MSVVKNNLVSGKQERSEPEDDSDLRIVAGYRFEVDVIAMGVFISVFLRLYLDLL